MTTTMGSLQPAPERCTSLIPQFDRAAGPVTRRLNRRLALGLGGAWLVGVVLSAVAPEPARAFGLGLILPGGGFLYGGHPVLAVGAFVGVFLFVQLWLLLATEVLVLPAWLVSAVLGSLFVGDTLEWARWAVPAAWLSVAAVLVVSYRLLIARQRREGVAFNKQLADITFPISSRNASPEVTESTEADLDALRYPLDLFLQPLDSYVGFSKIDQFREGSLRYQLNWGQFALATAQFTRTPAFSGYLSEAQRNAIEKVRQPLNWRYWRWENLWGNGEWNPDPVRRMNIMLPGFYGTSVGLYQSVTGDERYSAPGALTFVDRDGTRFSYDYPSMSACVVRDVESSAIKLQPCEPSWIYSICNTFTLQSLQLHGRLNDDPSALAALDQVVANYQREFMRPDGHFTTFRAKRGPQWPWAHNWSEAMICVFGNAAMPEVTRRTWWLLRQRTGDVENLRTSWMDRIDLGNYHYGSDVGMRIALLLAAREMGDHEMATATLAYLDAHCNAERSPGLPLFERTSVLHNLGAVQGLFMRENVMRDMVAFGAPEHWHTGPILAECAYPDVLVARAVTDGQALDLVLRPGSGPVRTTLRLARLVPGATYHLRGCTERSVVAGGDGSAVVSVDLSDRLEVQVTPQR